MDFILVFIGGGLGSLLRYILGQLFEAKHIHYCTLGINIIACLLIGILSGLIIYKSNLNKLFSVLLITGFCGGFSTLSAYSLDIINLFRNGHPITALLYMILTVTLCLFATISGLLIVKYI